VSLITPRIRCQPSGSGNLILQSSNLSIFQFCIFEPVKKVIAIVFILLLSAQYVFKLGIITYFETNREYIAEVLCVNKTKPITMCYGQCFLNRNLSVLENEDASRPVTTFKYQIESTAFIYQANEINLSLYSQKVEKMCPFQTFYSFSSDVSIFHPPC
jgi:hypothetical protein